MEQKLYYTRQELFNIPHTRFMETENSILFNLLDADEFMHYKKLYLLQKFEPDVTEIYVEADLYNELKEHCSKIYFRYIEEFNGYIFFSIKDMLECLEYANTHKLF